MHPKSSESYTFPLLLATITVATLVLDHRFKNALPFKLDQKSFALLGLYQCAVTLRTAYAVKTAPETRLQRWVDEAPNKQEKKGRKTAKKRFLIALKRNIHF